MNIVNLPLDTLLKILNFVDTIDIISLRKTGSKDLISLIDTIEPYLDNVYNIIEKPNRYPKSMKPFKFMKVFSYSQLSDRSVDKTKFYLHINDFLCDLYKIQEPLYFLRDLRLELRYYDDNTERYICKFSNLKKLELNIPNFELRKDNLPRSLETFKLQFFSKNTPISFSAFKNYQNLKSIYVENFIGLSNAEKKIIFPSLQNLETLVLNNSSFLTAVRVNLIIDNQPNLTYLEARCVNFLSYSLPKINTFINDSILFPLIDGVISYETLESLTIGKLNHNAIGYLPKLTSLELTNELYSLDILDVIHENCPKLYDLSLTGYLDDRLSVFTNLKSLNLNCAHFESESIGHLTSLTLLRVYRSDITDAALSKLTNLTSLELNSVYGLAGTFLLKLRKLIKLTLYCKINLNNVMKYIVVIPEVILSIGLLSNIWVRSLMKSYDKHLPKYHTSIKIIEYRHNDHPNRFTNGDELLNWSKNHNLLHLTIEY